jgi:hypothetical protein
LQAINDEGMRPFRHVASGGAVVPHIRGSGVGAFSGDGVRRRHDPPRAF